MILIKSFSHKSWMFRAGYNLIILFLCRGMRRGYEARFCSPFFSNIPYISIPSFYLTYLKNYSGKYLAQKQLRDGVERYKKKCILLLIILLDAQRVVQ